ncbi:MAG TPA: hypothetical protein VG710_17535 [Opitutus sp.]|nr:hypothetical protein [Opitutus sp.]
MSEHDEAVFVDAFTSGADALKKESDRQWLFCVGDCEIQFARCWRSGGEVFLGRIAVATHGFGTESPQAPEAERMFKRMRSRLKKNYTNRLIAANITIPGSERPYRNVWLGPDARKRCQEGSIRLRSSPDSRVIWKEEPNQPLQPTRPFGPRG